MKDMKKIISLGDIHGRDVWKFALFGSSYDFNIWRTAVDNGAPIDWDPEMPFLKFDKIVFIGDYVDSFNIISSVIVHNLHEIIELKKLLGDRIVLLWGNHDVQYFVKNQRCSGHRPDIHVDLESLFRGNEDLFQMAFQVGDHLWTHAGVTSHWLKELRSELFDPRMRFAEIVKDENPETIADMINLGWQFRLPSIFNCDADNGGYQTYGGPIWVRPKRLVADPLEGINQIVGHTTCDKILIEEVGDIKYWFIDCLEFGVEEVLELEVHE